MKIKIISSVLFVVFVFFASLQFNDPDSAVWITIYGLTALACLLNTFGIYHRPSLIAMIVIMALYSVIDIPSIFDWLRQPDKAEVFGAMEVGKMYIEETREFLGLWIAIGGLYYILRVRRRTGG